MKTLLLVVAGISLLVGVVLGREFLEISGKRRSFVQLFQSGAKGTKGQKKILIISYIVLTLAWTIGGVLYFFWFIS